MLTNKKLIIFDLDGTLIDSIGVWNKVDETIIERIRQDGGNGVQNIQKERDEALSRYRDFGNPYLEYYRFLKEKYSARESAEEISQMRKALAQKMIELEVDYKPNAPEVIKALHAGGFTLAIASTTRKMNMEIYRTVNRNILDKAPLDDYFSAIYTHEDAKNIKPDPEIHVRLMQEFGVLPSECLVFEDSLVGAMAAKNAGIPLCVVYDKHSDGDREKLDSLADYAINDFGEVLNQIKKGQYIMTLNEAITKLNELETKMYAFNCASSALYLDGVTVAPKETSEGRGIALGILAGESHKLFSAPEVGELLEFLCSNKDELDEPTKRRAEILMRDYKMLSKIPAEEYMEYARLTNDASDVWHKAKETNDFELFAPYLEKLVEFNIKFAAYYDPNKLPYDALLNEYERGADMVYLDNFFGTLREKLVPVIKAISQKPQIDDSFLHKHYPAETQRKFSDYLMEVMNLDRLHCTIGETEHPFTLNFNTQDVRITTNYCEDSLADSMYSVIHEGGHALYELGVDPKFDYTCLAGGVSMGVHESQSRFYENIIGRSEAFVKAIFPKVKEFFPEQLDGVDAEMFYKAINKAEPSLIRTEADELTYCFHVMIRYEIEKKLISRELAVKDIPTEWNRLYKEYLGVDVPDDTRGCLQDSHWSGGSFGYFPSYALGSAYGAQMLSKMESEISVWDDVSKGDISGVTAWLKENVHKYGSLKEPGEIVKSACGGEFDPNFYTDYLKNKFTKLYDL